LPSVSIRLNPGIFDGMFCGIPKICRPGYRHAII
jgi:hypothetical protein